MKSFKSSVYFAWLLLVFPSFLLYGEVESSSSYHQDSRITPFSQNILLPEDRDNGKLYTTNILLARNEQTIAGKRRANRKKRKHTKKSVIQAEYESCKNKDLSSLALKKERASKITEGGFCFTCFGKNVFGFSEIKETTKTLQSKSFKEKLQKRVIGQIESKLFQVGIHKACVKPDRKWFDDKKIIDWPLMKAACASQKRKLKSSIQSRWSKMRVNLSLISPSISESRIVTDRPTWFDSSPSHHISSFKDTSLPKLTAKEKKEAEKLYIDKVSKVSLEHFSEAEFEEILLKQQSIPGVLSGGDKYITGRDQSIKEGC